MGSVVSLSVVQKAPSREFSFVVKEKVMEKDRVEKAEIWLEKRSFKAILLKLLEY